MWRKQCLSPKRVDLPHRHLLIDQHVMSSFGSLSTLHTHADTTPHDIRYINIHTYIIYRYLIHLVSQGHAPTTHSKLYFQYACRGQRAGFFFIPMQQQQKNDFIYSDINSSHTIDSVCDTTVKLTARVQAEKKINFRSSENRITVTTIMACVSKFSFSCVLCV